MQRYYVNKIAQENGDHEVHIETCAYLPIEQNRTFLGVFSNCHDAVNEAKKIYPRSNGCYFCSFECHTS